MYNKAILVGRLTASPELKQTPNGVPVAQFTIAVDRRYKGKNGEKIADFLRVVAWRSAAEFVAKYFAKGDAIGVEGSIQTRSYEDKDGIKRTAVEIVTDNAFFVGAKTERREAPQQDFEEVPEETNDLPF